VIDLLTTTKTDQEQGIRSGVWRRIRQSGKIRPGMQQAAASQFHAVRPVLPSVKRSHPDHVGRLDLSLLQFA